jgi:hypothetical protein
LGNTIRSLDYIGLKYDYTDSRFSTYYKRALTGNLSSPPSVSKIPLSSGLIRKTFPLKRTITEVISASPFMQKKTVVS